MGPVFNHTAVKLYFVSIFSYMFCIWLFSEGVTTADNDKPSEERMPNDNPSDETENAPAVIVPESGKSNQM